MDAGVTTLNSGTVGDPARFVSFGGLVSALDALPHSPLRSGRVALVVRRRDGGSRHTPDRVAFTIDGGVEGDAWGRKEGRALEAQITVMEVRVAELIANGQPLAMFGDNLFLDLDLSDGNLPTGSRIRAGGAVLEVSSKPHNGCAKFSSRFGADALRFVSRPETRPRNLRGIYMRVVSVGGIGPGDPVDVL